MNDISKRISEILAEKEISVRSLAERTGIPKSAMQRYITGETGKIPISRVPVIAKALGVSAAYLMGWAVESAPYDEADVDELTEDERTLIQAYRKLNAEGQRTLLATAIAFSNNPYMCLQDSEEEILKDTDEVINKNNKDMA